MPAKEIDYSCLINLLDTSWGRSSTLSTASRSVKFSLLDGSKLKATYGAIVNFSREQDMLTTKRRESADADNLIKQLLDVARAQYKELTGNSIKFTQLSGAEDVHIISHSPYNPRRTAKFIRVVIMEIG